MIEGMRGLAGSSQVFDLGLRHASSAALMAAADGIGLGTFPPQPRMFSTMELRVHTQPSFPGTPKHTLGLNPAFSPFQPSSARSRGGDFSLESLPGGVVHYGGAYLPVRERVEALHRASYQSGSARSAFSARSLEELPALPMQNGGKSDGAWTRESSSILPGLAGAAGEAGTGALPRGPIPEAASVAPAGVPFSSNGGNGGWSGGGTADEDAAMAFFADMDGGKLIHPPTHLECVPSTCSLW